MIGQIIDIPEEEIVRIYKETRNDDVKNEIEELAEAFEQPLFIIEFFYQYTGGDEFAMIQYLVSNSPNDKITEI